MLIFLDMPDILKPGVEDVIKVFFPESTFVKEKSPVEPELYLKLQPLTNLTEQMTVVNGQLCYRGTLLEHREQSFRESDIPASNKIKILSQLTAYRLMERVAGTPPSPWGILTGIRPTKIVHRFLDRRLGKKDILERLQLEFAVHRDKAELIYDIALGQRPFLPSAAESKHSVSIYIGVPFCPTRCLYCSFPAYPIQKFKGWIEPYTESALKEIRAVGKALKEHGVQVQTIYFGGGTPTCLPLNKLQSLLVETNNFLGPGNSREGIEMTMEGGRPDTLSRAVLELCASQGINRLSINPQTMQEHTLHAIGRSHTVEDVYRAMLEARQIGFPIINMDIILGLPGETAVDVADTMRQLGELKPENLSVHTLAVKNASRLRQEINKHPLPGREVVEDMAAEARTGAKAMGLIPYYLYRQKRMLGNLENVGYAALGKECVYNIQIMEERQTVIGIGVGSGTKWVNPGDWFLVSSFNPKEPKLYVERIDDLVQRKVSQIHSRFGTK